MDLSKLSLAELKDLSARIAEEEKKRAKEEIEAARNEIYAIAHRLGMPLKDLIGNGSVVRKPTGKVAVQYRNPANAAQEWSGRGRQPKWVKELIASGADLQTAKVKA
jgi:DNA-binding protein H-NS